MDVRAEIGRPGRYRSGAAPRAAIAGGGTARARARTPGSEEIDFTTAVTTLGPVLVARSERGLRAVLLGDDGATLEGDLRARFPRSEVRARGEEMAALAAEVVALVESPARPVEVPLDPEGTAFQRRVWEALREIPAGETASYAEIAARIGRPGAARAVARACAANALAVVVPCHRVVRGDGGLSGYRWGADRKRILLRREAGG